MDFEILRSDLPRGRFQAVLFDFDGTLSLLREGWPRIMCGMMVEALVRCGTGESETELGVLVEDFVMALNGRPAITQMERLVDEIRSRGGSPEIANTYLAEYDRRLLRVVNERAREIHEGRSPPERWAVPGSHALLAHLHRRGLKLYLASGTHLQFVRSEADLLNLSGYFGNEIHAPDRVESTFSKRAVIERILSENNLRGEELLSFGDGVVEIQEVRRVGGTAVAVASDEPARGVNRWKRDRLVPAGADVVIADYRSHHRLLEWLLDPPYTKRRPMPYPQFDRSRLRLQPLAKRQHDLTLADLLPLDSPVDFGHPALPVLAERLVAAKRSGAARMLVIGAHVLRAGVQRYLIDLMERGLIDHIAMNGAGPIHDWEIALIGATTESVARYVRTGEFGLWTDTGRLNDVIAAGVSAKMGIGESIGNAIAEGDFPYKDVSVLAAAYRLRVPVTVHIGIGYDIIHEHPNCDGAALGQASYTDFLVFAQTCTRLEGGVMLNFGSAVMGPEVYLKALTMARNVAHQEGGQIAHFTTAVFDLIPLEGDTRQQAPKTDPRYYYRPWKTILVRTVADGGESFYVAGDHRATIPALHRLAIAL